MCVCHPVFPICRRYIYNKLYVTCRRSLESKGSEKKERKAGGPPVWITNCRRRGAITNRSCRSLSLYSPQSLTRYKKNKKKKGKKFFFFFIIIIIIFYSQAQTTIELLERSMILTRWTWTRIGTRVCVYLTPRHTRQLVPRDMEWRLTKNSVVGASSSVYRYQISRAKRRYTLPSICRIPLNRIDCPR